MGEGLVLDLSNILAGEEASQGPQVNPLSIEGSTWSFLDGDTIKDSETGKSVRLRGIDTRETAKFLKDSGYEEGELGGNAATAYIQNLANKHGFNRVVTSGEFGEFDREMGDLQNAEGHSFVDTLLRTGVVSPSRFSTEGDLAQSRWGMAAEASQTADAPKSDWEEARAAIYEAETEQYGGLPMQKLMAFDHAEFAANPEIYMGVKSKVTGADYAGRSRTPFGTGFDIGYANLSKGLNTLGATLANRLGASEIEASFAADASVNQSEMNDMPSLKMDVTEINWKKFDEVTDGMMGMLGSSVPFMGATMVGMAAAGPTMGASMALPVSMYTGMVLDEMEGPIEDKNLMVAIVAGAGATALDRIGLKGILSPSMMITKEGRAEAIKAIAKKEGITEAAASQLFLKQTQKGVLEYVDNAKDFAAAQIQKGLLFKEGVKRLAQGGTGEGITEAMQELTQYTAAVIGSEKEWDFDEIQHRMQNAIVAGGLMGAGFSAPSAATQGLGWSIAGDPYNLDDGRFDNMHSAVRKSEEDANGFVQSIDDITEFNARREAEGVDVGEGIRARENDPIHVNDRAAKHKPPGTTMEFVKAFMYNPMVALRGSWANTVYKADGKSATLVKMYDMVGSARHRVFGGTNKVMAEQLKMAEYDSVLRDQEAIEASFNTPKHMSAKQRSDYVSNLTKQFYKEVLQPAAALGKPLNWSKASPEVIANKDALLLLDKELNTLSDKMLNDGNSARKNDGEAKVERLANWAYRHKGFRKEHIERNKGQFIGLLMSEYKMDNATASALTEAILDHESVSTIGQAFDITKGAVTPGSMKARKMHISDKPAFDQFVEQNLFKNMGDASRESSRLQAHRKYIGKDSKYINRMLTDVHKELLETMDPESAEKLLNEISFDIVNILNADSGNYKQIQNQAIKQGQKYLTLLTTLQGLSNAAFSSIPEMAMIPYGVPRDVLVQNSATQGYLFGSAVGAYIRNIMSIARVSEPREEMDTFLDKKIAEVRSKGKKDPRYMFYTNMKDMLKQTGFKSQETGAATTTGVQETNELTKGITDAFFKANFLHDQQDMHRMMRLSFFNDFLIDKLDLIASKEGQPDTVGVAEAKNMLRELGIPLGVIAPLSQKLKNGGTLTEAEAVAYKREFLNGAANFVNQAIPLPNAYNRPLFYSDPRFALLTQFNGFTSTFTANQLPMLWDQLKGKGTRGMTYSTFAAMGSMVALAFISQGMKDELKYGESSPYLTDAQKIQRAIYSSGLLGTTERVIGSNYMLPLYAQGSNGPTGFLWDNVAGEAAATGTVERAYGMLSSAAEGDKDVFMKNFYGSLPFVASYKHRIINWNME